MVNHILVLLVTLCISSVSADVSIDCGSSDIFTSENSILWTGDDSYIQNGESRVVPSSNSISPVMDTLRVFMTRKKNCYSIEATKGQRVLVRASFYYGNYDKKSSPPTFDLQFNGNYWVTVETSKTDYVYYEVIYVLKRDYVSVCVAQTKPGQFPFISALEVRSLLSSMYYHVDQNYPLHLIKRVAYGANETIRYTDDLYDRIWTPAVGGNGLTTVASDALFIETDVRDQPPLAVLQNAVTASSPTARIQLLMGFPPVEVPVYLNMYFSEVAQLDTAQKRSFQVLLNDEPLLDHPVIPPFDNCTELNASNYTVSSNATFTLVPTDDSTLPPLINAMEVFVIGDELTDGTNNKDVEGLASLRNAFDLLQDWNGDPCLPSPYSWDWINCNSDPTPRVTALYLSSFDLSGELPDFSSMDALETIDFHNNSLEGLIPDFLATLPNLKKLNLAGNQFSGPVPDPLSKKKGLNLVVTGNPDLSCTSANSCMASNSPPTNDPRRPSSSSGGAIAKKRNSKKPVILGTTIPIFIIIWAVVGVKLVLRCRRKAAAAATFSSGANRPEASPLNAHMIGKIGQAITNNIKINIEDQSTVELADQTNQQGNNGSTSLT